MKAERRAQDWVPGSEYFGDHALQRKTAPPLHQAQENRPSQMVLPVLSSGLGSAAAGKLGAELRQLPL
jgi:hypothetical protein